MIAYTFAPSRSQFFCFEPKTEKFCLYAKRVALVALAILMCITIFPSVHFLNPRVRQWFKEEWSEQIHRVEQGGAQILRAKNGSELPLRNTEADPRAAIVNNSQQTLASSSKLRCEQSSPPLATPVETSHPVFHTQKVTSSKIEIGGIEKSSPPLASPAATSHPVFHTLKVISSKIEIGGIEKNLGNDWLLSKAMRKKPKVHCDDYTLMHYLIDKKRKKIGCNELAKQFPDRTVDGEDIAKLSTIQILSLNLESMFSIIDLLSEKQAIEIIQSPSFGNTFKYCVSLFHPQWGEIYLRSQRLHLEQPVSMNAKIAAGNAYEKYCKTFVNADSMKTMMASEAYLECDALRRLPSNSLNQQDKQNPFSLGFNTAWLVENEKRLPDGLVGEVTIQLLEEINKNFREMDSKHLDPYAAPEQSSRIKNFYDRPLGLRCEFEHQVSNPAKDCWYPHPSVVREEMEDYLRWLNEKLYRCDQGSENPILVAAEAFQRLVSLHPFMDANGRTARFLADLILRRYGLLPVAWGVENLPIQAFDFPNKKVNTPTDAVVQMLVGLERTYQLFGMAAGGVTGS